jgi:hypothetical protein
MGNCNSATDSVFREVRGEASEIGEGEQGLSPELISQAAFVTAMLLWLMFTFSAPAAATGSTPTLVHPAQTPNKSRTWYNEQSRTLNEPDTRIGQTSGSSDRSNSSGGSNFIGVLILLALCTLSPFLYQVVKRVLRRRHDKWRVEAWHICVRVAELRTALGRLMQLVPETAGWCDEGWSEGERKAGELARSSEKLNTMAPRADRDSLWDLVAVLRSLEIVIGNDPQSRARPLRAEGISHRLADLEAATRSLERSMD